MQNQSFSKTKAAYYAKKVYAKLTGNNLDLVSPFIDYNSSSGKDVRYLVRVDDFPHWEHPSQIFKDFHGILKDNGIPYLLGVTPKLSISPLKPGISDTRDLSTLEVSILNELSNDSVEIAMHGFTHKNHSGHYKSEFSGREPENIVRDIEEGMAIFKKLGITPNFFIPPFNAVSKENLSLLARYFKLVTGGEESINSLGYKWGFSSLCNTIYYPSYPPLYGKASDILRYIRSNELNSRKMPFPLPLTLHWSWEVKDNFNGIKMLAGYIRGRVISWKEALKQNE